MSLDLTKKFKDMTDEEEAQAKLHIKLGQMAFEEKGHTHLKLPKWHGEQKADQMDYRTWKQCVKCLIDDGNYPNTVIVRAIRAAVQGQAFKIIRTLAGTESYDKFILALDNAYGGTKEDDDALKTFYNAQQKPKESLLDWYIRIQELYDDTLETGIRRVDSVLKKRFFKGLSKSSLQRDAIHKYDDATVTTALLFTYMKRLEDEKDIPSVKATMAIETDETVKLRKELAELKLQLAQKEQLTPKETRTCYHCNKRGHLMKDCWHNPARQSQYGEKNQQHTHTPSTGCGRSSQYQPRGVPPNWQSMPPPNWQSMPSPNWQSTPPPNWPAQPRPPAQGATQPPWATYGPYAPPWNPYGQNVHWHDSANDKGNSNSAQQIESRLLGKERRQTITIQGVTTLAIIDTGSVVSSMSRKFYDDHCQGIQLKSFDGLFNNGFHLYAASGDEIPLAGYVEVEVELPGLNKPLPIIMTVNQKSILNTEAPALIGTNVMDEWKHHLNEQHKVTGKLPSINEQLDNWIVLNTQTSSVKSVEATKIPPGAHKCNFIKVKLHTNAIREHDRSMLFTPYTDYDDTDGIHMEPTLFTLAAGEKSATINIPTHNHGQKMRKITKKTVVGCIEPLHHTMTVTTQEISDADFFANFNNITNVSQETVNKLYQLLKTHKEAFANSSKDLGECTVGEHRITVDDPTPKKIPYRKIPLHMYEAVKEEIQLMLENKVISPSYSPWASPITIVEKKDGTPRICVDYRYLNSKTKKDAKSIPRTDEMIDALQGSSIFSSLDLMSGYWQIKLEEKSKELTAFTAGPLGFYEFNRMPFGLCNSGATFQRLMELILKPLLGRDCLVYIDDIIVFSSNENDHLHKLDRVLHTLRTHGLKLKPTKCKFLMKELTFLGHKVTANGVTKDEEKVKVIKDWKEPTCVKELRSFMGMAGYLRKFIKGFSLIALPLTDLLRGYDNKKSSKKKNKELEKKLWHWGNEQQKAFDDLKYLIAEDVTLAYADPREPFRVCVDASKHGFGAILEQQHEGKWRPIAFASRKTNDSEKNYATCKLEFKALQWAVAEKFKDYLGAARFEVHTDNNPLTYVFHNAKLDSIGQRWAASLADFNMKCIYKPGKDNRMADALSRREQHMEDNTSNWQEWAKKCIVQTEQANEEALPEFDWLKLQAEDEDLTLLVKYVENKQQMSPEETNNLRKDIRYMNGRFEKLTLQNGLLFYIDANKLRYIPPKEQREQITEFLHNNGHFGRDKTLQKVKENYYWPGMYKTVKTICDTCKRCQISKTSPAMTRGPLCNKLYPTAPLKVISMDFLGIDTRATAKYKILTIVDEFTKFGFALEVKSENARNLAKVLFKEVYSKFGIPSVVHTDNGKPFISKVFEELNKIFKIRHTTTTPYRPQSNAGCERLNRTIIDRIRTLSDTEKRKWHEHLPGLLLAYNATVHDATKVSPFFAMFGRTARLPEDCILNTPQADMNNDNQTTWLEARAKDIKEAYEACAKNVLKRQLRNKKNHDQRLPQTAKTLQPGDRVVIVKKNRVNKVDDYYNTELHTVLHKTYENNDAIFTIQAIESGIIKVYHRDNLHCLLERPSDAKNTDKRMKFENIKTWDTTNTHGNPRDSEYTVNSNLNKRVGIFYGESNRFETESCITVQRKPDVISLSTTLKECAQAKDIVLEVHFAPTMPNKDEVIAETLKSVREFLLTNKQHRIIVCISSHTLHNKVLESMHKYFPQKKQKQHPPIYAPESDDELPVDMTLYPPRGPEAVSGEETDSTHTADLSDDSDTGDDTNDTDTDTTDISNSDPSSDESDVQDQTRRWPGRVRKKTKHFGHNIYDT